MDKYKNFIYCASFIIVIFIVSNFLPWTNPYPEHEVYKPFNDLIFFWQYDSDTPGEVLSSLYFPEYFEKNNTRLERPGYLIPSFFFSEFLKNIFNLLNVELSDLYFGTAGYLITKIIFYLISMMMCIGIYERYFDRKIAIISTFALFLSWESIRMISQINTSEFQFLYPIIATYLITNVHKERIIKSLILVFFIGYLITVKHNIAIILAIISYFIIYKKIKEAFLFIIVISLFPLFYLIYINNLGYEIYFHLFESDHSYGSWILSSDLNAIFLAFIKSIFVFLKYNFDYYFIFLIPFIIFLSNKNSYIKFRKEILFGFLLIFFTFIQGYAAQKFGRFTFDQMTYHTRAYMVGDYAFIIFWTFGIILQNNYYLFKRYVNFIFIVWFSYSSIFFINLPWKHPNEQPSRNWQERVKNLPK